MVCKSKEFPLGKILSVILYIVELIMETYSIIHLSETHINIDTFKTIFCVLLIVYVIFRMFVFYIIIKKDNKRIIAGIILCAVVIWVSTYVLSADEITYNGFNYMYRNEENDLKQQYTADTFFNAYFTDKNVYMTQQQYDSSIFADSSKYSLYEAFYFNLVVENNDELFIEDDQIEYLLNTYDYYNFQYNKRKLKDDTIEIFAYIGADLKDSDDIVICSDINNNLYFTPLEKWESINDK